MDEYVSFYAEDEGCFTWMNGSDMCGDGCGHAAFDWDSDFDVVEPLNGNGWGTLGSIDGNDLFARFLLDRYGGIVNDYNTYSEGYYFNDFRWA